MQLGLFSSNLIKASLVTLALSVSAFAGADEYFHDHQVGGCAPVCHPHTACNTGCDSCCGTPCLPAPACNWGYNPPAYTRCASCDTGCCNGLFDSLSFRADFLWWRVCEGGLDLGFEEYVNSTSTTTAPIRTTVEDRTHTKRPNFKYDPGFRIGLINHCACDCWDFAVNWIHFRTKAYANGISDEAKDITFFSDWERIVGANPQKARGRYTLNLDLVDLEFGRKFYVSKCFVLRPQFGLRFARINQSYRIVTESDTGTLELERFTTEVKAHSDFLSVGPRVGLDIELDVGCGLSLFGNAAGSILFGKFDNHAREFFVDTTTVTNPAVEALNYEARSSAHRCSRTITDLAFGVKWTRCFEWCNRCHPVSLAFAWEHHGFYNFNNFNFAARGYNTLNAGPTGAPNGNNVTKHGDLYTQGLTLSLCFGF